jgi:molecular chaperone DnaK
MKQDAETHAEEDRKRRELVDTKNQGDALAYQMEKMLKEQGEKVAATDRGNIESAISGLREALKTDDAEAIKRAMENLEKSSHAVAEAMYKAAADAAQTQAQAAPGPEQTPPQDEGKDGDDVIDAEYEVKE